MNQRNLRKHTLYLMGALALLLVLWVSFGGKGDAGAIEYAADTSLTEPPTVSPAAPAPVAQLPAVADSAADAAADAGARGDAEPDELPERAMPQGDNLLAVLSASDTLRALNRYEAHYDSMPPGGRKIRINSVGPLRRVFNDSNYLHIAAARSAGVSPIRGVGDAWRAGASLSRLRSCQEYYLDNLTHSLPYLVPQAHRLLTDIGAAFRDSLQARGGGDYRIKVTSVLRTSSLVKSLRRRNRNAVDTSAHLFGTTFDISYAKFICDNPSTPRTQEDMKNLLAEVVFAMRNQGRCYVKYEHKQACFHITAR